jgi:glycosyltransferase involved in cell wall biosynthesis
MTKQGKKKVLFVINDFLIGGAQRLYVELFLHLSAEQYEFHLVTLSDFSDRPHMFSMVPAHVTVHKLNFKGFTDVKSWYEMNSLLKKVSPDILVTSLFFSNTVSRVLCFFKLYKVVAIEQNTYTWKRLHHNLVDKILSFKTAQLVAASKTVARFAAKKAMIREEQFLVIHNSIDTNLIRQAKETLKGKEEFYRNDCGISKESKIIINVARLVPQKNLEVLIEAFALFTKHRKDYTLVIFGAGSLEATLREKIKSLQIESRCFLAGTRQNIFPYYFISEFFCFKLFD